MFQVYKTTEFVTPKHPDKLCDFIADSILDAHLSEDKNARVAVEVMGGHGLVTLNGEVTSSAKINEKQIVRGIVGRDYEVISNIAAQSPEIAQGVDTGGAGDQGIMVGFASRESEDFVPKEYFLARKLCQKIYGYFPFDGKVQVTLSGFRKAIIVASCQNSESSDIERIITEFCKENRLELMQCLANPAGQWAIGGFDADSGLSGRKLVIDNYGPQVPIGGGSFSGKDYTKVDRSGAYMARKVAVDLLEKRGARVVLVKLAYAIGIAKPVMATAYIDGRTENIGYLYDFTPAGIREALKLESVKFAETCVWGHFGRNFPWDKPFEV